MYGMLDNWNLAGIFKDLGEGKIFARYCLKWLNVIWFSLKYVLYMSGQFLAFYLENFMVNLLWNQDF